MLLMWCSATGSSLRDTHGCRTAVRFPSGTGRGTGRCPRSLYNVQYQFYKVQVLVLVLVLPLVLVLVHTQTKVRQPATDLSINNPFTSVVQ
jgi:hypothetical protein